jgi:hypothetical protein
LVKQELLLQNEYLAAENRILKTRLQPGWRLPDGERATLAEIGRRLGRKGLEQVACIAKPDTILAWYRKLMAKKFDGSKRRRSPGRQRTTPEIEDLVVRCARENSGWDSQKAPLHFFRESRSGSRDPGFLRNKSCCGISYLLLLGDSSTITT